MVNRYRNLVGAVLVLLVALLLGIWAAAGPAVQPYPALAPAAAQVVELPPPPPDRIDAIIERLDRIEKKIDRLAVRVGALEG